MPDKLLLERNLANIKYHLKELREADDITWQVYSQNIRDKRFVERTLHILIENCIDTANHIISSDNLREALSYRDAFAVLAENNIITTDDLKQFAKIVSFRDMLVYNYESINDEIIYGIFKHLNDFDLFVNRICDYIFNK